MRRSDRTAFPFRGGLGSKSSVDDRDAPFAWRGPDALASPVVLAVPHAGRDYPAPLLAAAAVPAATLRQLEDRYADLLIADAVAAGHRAMVAHVARACVDLNRDPDDREGRDARGKWRQGQGVFPAATPDCGMLWRGPFAEADLDRRIARIHAPYHRAIADALEVRRARFGAAMLVDIHSMPRHAGRGWPRSADLVLGDRKATTTSAQIADRLAAVARAAGLSCVRNHPYAGGHGVHRHADPARGIHGVQVEIARDLYLDRNGHPRSEGVAAISALVKQLADTAAATMRAVALPPAEAAE